MNCILWLIARADVILRNNLTGCPPSFGFGRRDSLHCGGRPYEKVTAVIPT